MEKTGSGATVTLVGDPKTITAVSVMDIGGVLLPTGLLATSGPPPTIAIEDAVARSRDASHNEVEFVVDDGVLKGVRLTGSKPTAS